MLEIYIVRHGKTLFNEKDLVQGACDSPLTKEGERQAIHVGENMKDIPFTLAFSSPSGRASDTCEYVTKKRLPIIYDKRLREMSFGYLEGEKNSTLLEGKPTDVKERWDVGWVKEGGENRTMVLERVDSFFKELIQKYNHEVVVIVSHGMWIKFAIEYLVGEEAFPQNCSVTKIDNVDGKFIARFIGDEHFKEEPLWK